MRRAASSTISSSTFLKRPGFRAVVNAGTRDNDLAWMRRHAAAFGVDIVERTDLAMLAVQGPEARGKAASLLSPAGATSALALEPFFGREIDGWFVARTGYTGEDGFEIMLPATEVERVWKALNSAGVTSCGLGARDTLRLEAGMNLYGSDMDESTHPFESGLGWTVALEPRARAFHRPRGAGGDSRPRAAAQAGRPAARGPWRPALASEGAGTRCRRRRDHQRNLFPDSGALDRAGPRAGRGRGQCTGRYSRQAARCAHRAAAVRPSRQSAGLAESDSSAVDSEPLPRSPIQAQVWSAA